MKALIRYCLTTAFKENEGRMEVMDVELCYCGSKKSYDACCGRFLSGAEKPETPEQLMRSRYSAFCIKNADYLVSTHHPAKRSADERQSVLESAANTKWLGMNVLKTEKKIKDSTIGYVEFIAFYRDPLSGSGQIHEKSEFIFENGRWYYVDGVMLPPVKFKRNDPCWCGRNKKFKKCHGAG